MEIRMKSGTDHVVAVTGARGLLGATLMRTLKNPLALEADVREAGALAEEILATAPSVVVHTAAITDIAACEHDPRNAYAVNAEGTKNVVEAARAIGSRILHVSTASIFKGDKGDYVETDTPEPGNVYNETKAQAEEFVRAYDRGIVVRLNVMGIHPAGSRGKNFMEWLVDSLVADKDVNLFDDVRINALSNWTIADMFAQMIEQNAPAGVSHIGTRDILSKAEIGALVAQRFPQYRGNITYASVDSIADGVPRPKEMWLNCDYTARTLGITMPPIRDEIDRIMQHYEHDTDR